MESCLTHLGKTCVEKSINGTLAKLRDVFCFTCISNEIKEEKVWLEGEIKAHESFLSKYYISFPSRETKYKQLLHALKDDNNHIIVLQGRGGIGKTTFAKKVSEELKESAQFTHVIETTVSFTPDIKKVQDAIARSLGMEWKEWDSDRSTKLLSRIKNGENSEKILLIMDNVWDQELPVDLHLIGIPKPGKYDGCKFLIITRNKQISSKMKCDKKIELELLSEEESWTMFKMYAGISNSLSKNLITKGFKIAKECKQLPVAIVVLAGSLKGQQHRMQELDATLKSLTKIVPKDNVDAEMVEIYKCLKFSYDYMKDEKAKGLFLLSSIFPEDKEIPIEILTRLGIGSGFFEDYDSYNDVRDQVVKAKNKLIDSCLLMEVNEEYVKVHELVREVAQEIENKEIGSVNLSNKGKESSVQRKINIKYLFCKGKDTDLFSYKYGSELEILVLDMERDEDCKRIEVSDSFFKNIGKLQVLYFIGHDKRSISFTRSIPSLTNIRSILVDGVDLGDISVFGNLKRLETLDLVKCKINELPQEIAELWRFKLLNLEECEITTNDPFEVIKKCSKLEELYFIDSFNASCHEITIPELKRYRIGTRWVWSRSNYLLSKCMAFIGHDRILSKETIKYCMQKSDSFQLNGTSIKEEWRNLVPDIVDVDQGMNDLVELRMSNLSQLKCLIDTNGIQVPRVILSKLVVLELDEMESLEVLFNGSLSFDSLKKLETLSIRYCKKLQRLSTFQLNHCNLKTVILQKCAMLFNLSSLLTSQNLMLLEKLEIVGCENLTKIIKDERGEKELREEIDDDYKYNKRYVPMFPKLKVLEVDRCCQLESILPLLSSQDLPVLEAITVSGCDKLKYIFGKYQHVELGSLKHILRWIFPKLKTLSVKNCTELKYIFGNYVDDHPNHNAVHLLLPELQCINLDYLRSLVSICPEQYRTTFPNLIQLKLIFCSLNNTFAEFLYIWKRAQCLPIHSSITCNVKEMTLSGSSKLSSVFMLSISERMMVETLRIENCDELQYIIVDVGDESDDITWGNVFPKLKRLFIQDCKKLKYIFGHYEYNDDHPNQNKIHLHLPVLQCLQLCNLENFVAICPKRYRTTFPPLIELELVECSPDNTVIQDLSLENFIPLKSLVVHNSKAENIISHNEIERQPMNLGLQKSELQDLHNMTCLFVGPENSFSLQNLKQMIIVRCERLEIAFSTSISICLPQLVYLRIENCDELKYIIKDDRQIQNITCFPKLRILVVIKCHKLKCVFSVKLLPRLIALMIREAHELEEIFKSEADQKVKLPILQVVVLENLPSLFRTQETQFQEVRSRVVENCRNLSLTSATTNYFSYWLLLIEIGIVDPYLKNLFARAFEQSRQLRGKTKDQKQLKDIGNENPRAETKKDTAVGIGTEHGAVLGHESTSSQLEKEQPTSQQENQQDLHGTINTTHKPSQGVEEGHALTNTQKITVSTHLVLASASEVGELKKKQLMSQHGLKTQQNALIEITTTVKFPQKLEKEQPASQQGLINQHDLLEEITTIVKPSQEFEKEQPTNQQGLINQQDPLEKNKTITKTYQGVGDGTTLTIFQKITAPTHLELARSSHVSEFEKERSTNQQGLINQQDPLEKNKSITKTSQELEKEKPTSQQGFINQQVPLGEIVKPSQEFEKERSTDQQGLINQKDPLEKNKSITKTSQELEKEQPTSQQGLINQQVPLGEVVKPSQEFEKERSTNQQGLINQQDPLEKNKSITKTSQELEKEQPTSQQGLINQQVPLGEVVTPSQESNLI
ncbi:uncharacterized protein LOC131601232 isoform X2 [Vicia villosa]|uniref:uncharacterized protein LOC131601232 isoform X2 n=1 Tax=Vicia villosa TaxID=3911 RepID=UPI00273C6187|nr:uncharacterized protein LOC131601232 isoform X2 [Vicia villosa]